MSRLHAIILAAGKGTRMKSSLPKVLHTIAGKPMIQHVIDTTKSLDADKISLIYGHGADQLKKAVQHEDLNWIEQKQQLGTGHALMQCVEDIEDNDRVLILYGDVPFISNNTLTKMVEGFQFKLLTLALADPSGYGRIIRDNEKVVGIVEQKDANSEQLKIKEINTGFMAVQGDLLKQYLAQLDNNNAQGEYYLTDIVALADKDGHAVLPVSASSEIEVTGVNSRKQLVALEKQHYIQLAEQWLDNGVTIVDPQRFDVRGELELGRDTHICPNFIAQGKVTIGSHCTIEDNVTLIDCDIADHTVIKRNTVIESCKIGQHAAIGPFARLRPGTELANHTQIGNFVEVKNAKLGEYSKAGHLAYVGDAVVGKHVNIGAGTITCNYDGAYKHKTVLEDHVFVGSDSQLVAPVTIGKGVTIAAGTTVTKDVAEDLLVISRTKQKTVSGWVRPQKEKK